MIETWQKTNSQIVTDSSAVQNDLYIDTYNATYTKQNTGRWWQTESSTCIHVQTEMWQKAVKELIRQLKEREK